MLLKTPAGCEFFASQQAMPREAVRLLDGYAFAYGDTYDAYLATENDRQYFWCPDRRGVVAFVRCGKVLNSVGGLLAAPASRPQLLKSFLEFVDLNKLTVNFFNLGRSQERIFRDHGFKLNKCTEELIVRLDRVSWQGRAYDWLRRQENFCIRQGIRTEEIYPEDDAERYRESIVPELLEVNEEHLAGTLHGRELVFFEGRFDPWSLRQRRLFVATHEGRIIAFIVCNPALSGAMWAIEMYRRRADAPKGVIPYAILQVMRQLKDEGIRYASLSSVPFLRCGPPINNDDHRFQAVCQFCWGYMNWLFDVRGIYHFKSRFRPAYREMYVATYPRMTYFSMLAMVHSWQVWRVSPLRLAVHLASYWRNRRRRRELAAPEIRPERKIRDLRPTLHDERHRGATRVAPQPGPLQTVELPVETS